ncbi:MAG: hypothetical protein H0T76_02400 [Nannocystis sp.]|nr:hypothetical protein [Nannocystis sp.]MBA3545312.1 hypothetical protein [Nannocystis sp.]
MVRPAFGLCLLVAGCTKVNPAFGADGVDTSTSAATTSPLTTAGAGSSTSLADTGGSTTGGDGSSGPDPTSGSTGVATTDVDPGTSTSAASSTTDPVDPPPPEHLQLYVAQNCTTPLWCFANQDVFAGTAARTGSQACFTPKMPPPYGLTRVGYVIAAKFSEPAASLQIFERTGAGPGKLLTELPLDAGGETVGPHAILFGEPLVIEVPGFCVGLVGGNKDAPGAGLGVAVDTTVLPPQQSYVRVDGAGGCDIPDWNDIATLKPNPSGAWCIDADVAKQL